ncbi:hypothetical protein [Streptomyces sp. Isolate_219]|uniref:hypothetical protein n=1 Tax=Streptomyces sp. Isolate_219 TaxID=2950110 RepID=UPI0021C70C2B|nr:hypothetical protein [Streptomyces sp. Isolate_219]MCR8574229.1 hypothetical protein [Streptomyces sp. Isolate_219]
MRTSNNPVPGVLFQHQPGCRGHGLVDHLSLERHRTRPVRLCRLHGGDLVMTAAAVLTGAFSL